MTALRVPAGSGFGHQHLPYGVASVPGGAPRVVTRVGDQVLDLALLLGEEVFAAPSLNPFMAQGHQRWVEVRRRIGAAVVGEVPAAAVHPVEEVTLHLPFEVADYVDFYASEHHAANLGRLFRPEQPDPLPPSWKHLPLGYHGRAASVVVSGTDVVRPCGQRKGPGDQAPVFGPSTRLDVEAELGFVVGTGSDLGVGVPVTEAWRRLFGVVLLNDWSARDIQAWEYVPLGPHLGKSFATTVSPWVVPTLALEAARVPLPGQHPAPLPYLALDEPGGLDVDLAIVWNGQVVSRPAFREMYWSPAQLLAHLSANGARTRTGDLLGSGTVSGPERRTRGAFIELTWDGAEPVEVAGEPRSYLRDGDEVVLTGSAPGPDGSRLSFGEARGRIVAARDR